MLFNSYVFLLVFLPVTWVIFRLVTRLRLSAAAMVTLVAASLVFYGYWNPKFVLLILLSVAFNYLWSTLLDRSRGRSRFLLALGIGVNLALLGYFKYTNFLLDNLSRAGLLPQMERDIVLPLGISFFTFVQIAYLVDIHRGVARRGGLLEYATFVTFFPQLIAGPIVRYREIVPCYGGLRLWRDELPERGRRPGIHRPGSVQEGRARRHPVAVGGRRIRHGGHAVLHRGLGGQLSLHVPDLLRLQRVFRHGHRRGQAVQRRSADQFQLPL